MTAIRPYLFAPADNDKFRHYIQKKISGQCALFILMDENTRQYCKKPLLSLYPEFEAAKEIVVESGEKNKNLETVNNIWLQMIQQHADRHALLINLGGGVITDIGGFAASSYKRGISFCHIPVSLLAMIDAAIGGKTGIDYEGVKNAVGSYSYAEKTYINPLFLETLPERHLHSGYAELLKIALVSDKLFWKKLKAEGFNDLTGLAGLIKKAVKLKDKIVIMDPEEKDIRKKLNFGHTIGHAVESCSLMHDTDILFHGESIAIGMICEAWISKKKKMISGSELDEIIYKVIRCSKKYKPEPVIDELLDIMANDKKNSGHRINFTLLTGIGEARVDNFIDRETIRESLMFYNSLI